MLMMYYVIKLLSVICIPTYEEGWTYLGFMEMLKGEVGCAIIIFMHFYLHILLPPWDVENTLFWQI